MEKAKTVGIWIRVSIEDQVKGESPEHHERHKPELRRIQRLTGQKALPFLHHKRRLYYQFLAPITNKQKLSAKIWCPNSVHNTPK